MTIRLEDYIREIPDFPKPGIRFKDIAPLLRNGPAFRYAIDEMALWCQREEIRIDACAGPEARGFVFASALAYRLGVGLVPIRKPGKLPHTTHRVEYDLEYGTDAIEMHIDAIAPGERVLLVDDLLATGGTIRACADLVEKSGGEVAGFAFAVELGFLEGRERLGDRPVHSLLLY